MIGFGTIMNMAAIILAGLIGSLFGNALKEKVQETLIMAAGLCVLFIGISGTLEEMFFVSEGEIISNGSMMIIGTFVIGSLVGEWIDIEEKMEQFGKWLKIKTKNEKDSAFVDAFVDTSLTVCIGAMAIVGAINDGIYGDYSLLAAKSVLDFIIVFVMTAARGKGCLFSAIPVGIFQGAITLLARFIEPIMTEQALSYLSMTGSMLIFCVGVNLIWGKKIKVANMLPTIVFAVLWAVFIG